MKLLLATRNAHKLREFERLLPGIEVEGLPPSVKLPPETGETYAANAGPKALAAARALGAPAIADDSGIEAEALAGAPGVRSARYAGEHASDADNLKRLRAEVPVGGRLTYVCALAYVDPDGTEHIFEGRCTGTMAAQPAGDGGFGYDPVFVPDRNVLRGRDQGEEDQRTMAQLSDAEKDAVSHRGRAARQLLAWLRDDGDGRS